MKTFIKALLRETLETCVTLNPTKEVVDFVNKFNSDEELLRSGGLPIDMLDRYAFGFTEDDITELDPSRIAIKWHTDLENVIWEVKKSGLSPIKWSEKINLIEPVDVSYELRGFGLKFYLEDGHHRYYAAKTLKKPLNVNLTIKANPINKITQNKLDYDNFHRCLFKQIKNKKLNEQIIDDENMNRGTETICDKLTVNSYQEALSYVEKAMHGLPEQTRHHLMQRLHIPLENMKQQQIFIDKQKKTEHMTGDSMPDEADTYWTEIQTVLCDAGKDFPIKTIDK